MAYFILVFWFILFNLFFLQSALKRINIFLNITTGYSLWSILMENSENDKHLYSALHFSMSLLSN